MDISPTGAPNGRAIVLLHGMNFGGFYFARPIEALFKAGVRWSGTWNTADDGAIERSELGWVLRDKHIKARTLVIGGEKDYDDYPEHVRRAAKLILKAELVLISGVGHVPHIRAPEMFEHELPSSPSSGRMLNRAADAW